MNGMHEIEDYRLYMSQMLPMMDKLTRHACAFESTHIVLSRGVKGKKEELTTTAKTTLQRAASMYRPAMALAFLLDPANFKITDIGANIPPFATLSPAMNAALKQARMHDLKSCLPARWWRRRERVWSFEACVL